MSFIPVTPDLFNDPQVSTAARTSGEPPTGIRAIGILSILYGTATSLPTAGTLLACGTAAWKYWHAMVPTDSWARIIFASLVGMTVGFLVVTLASYSLLLAGIRAFRRDPVAVLRHRRAACSSFVGWGMILVSQTFAIRIVQQSILDLLARFQLSLDMPSPTLLLAAVAVGFLAYPGFVLIAPPLFLSRVQQSPFDVPKWQNQPA